MLITYGNTTVKPTWEIDEKNPLGFSRIYYIYSGEVTYTDNYCTKNLKVGHLYIFPSSSIYKMVHNLGNPLCCTYMHLDLFPIFVAELIEVEVGDNSLLQSILSTISVAIDNDNSKIVSSLADTFELFLKENSIITPPILQISKVLLYIASNINEKISVEQLSFLMGYNSQYFIRLFKRYLGMTPHQYIINYRLKEAVKLLKTDCYITHVAEVTGYSDVKSFSRAFKERFGLSPSKFRQSYTTLP